MKHSKFSFRKTLLATGIAVGLGLSQTAMADPSATHELEVQVELVAGLSLSCSALDFGTVNIELTGSDSRPDSNTVTVVAATGEKGSISGSGNASHGDNGAPASCSVTAAEADKIYTIKVDTAPNELEFERDGGTTDVWDGLELTSLTFDATAFSDNSATGTSGTLDNTGAETLFSNSGTEAQTLTFFMGGVLTLGTDPIGSANLGLYSTSVVVTVAEGGDVL